MSAWTRDTLLAALGGPGAASWLREPRSNGVDGISIDTRTIRPGQVFVALRGERTDGHAHLADAARAGASILVVDRRDRADAGDAGVLLVRDTLVALHDLARFHRRHALERTTVIGVTGSSGKTTTSRLIHAILSTRLRGSAPAKSFNNHVGVPLTVLGAGAGDDYLVCELGTNHPGEIDVLARLIRARIGVVTGIGHAHVEAFGTREAIAREKGRLLDRLEPSPAGPVLRVIPGDEPLLGGYRPAATFGVNDDCSLRLDRISPARADDPPGVAFRVGGLDLHVPLLGRHNALNAGAAIAVARHMGLSWDDVRAGLARARPADMRLAHAAIAGIDVLNDAYNANPESMLAALRTLREISPRPGGRRVAVLGDMLELGDRAPDLHRSIVEDLAREPPDEVILIGAHFARAGAALARQRPDATTLISSADDAGARLAAGRLRPRDLVLVKGSRGMRLERVVQAISTPAPT